ncbi:MAG: hypothetical protein HYW15_02545 [Candidatus Giovannonibacteria bacterium]|nr:MAG: hypothetical protein HYW15_02545 [Candidatus Giovannonibacteria bacterium]
MENVNKSLREQLRRLRTFLAFLIPVGEMEEEPRTNVVLNVSMHEDRESLKEIETWLGKAPDNTELLAIVVGQDSDSGSLPLMPLPVCVAVALFNGHKLGLSENEVMSRLRQAYDGVMWEWEDGRTTNFKKELDKKSRVVPIILRRISLLLEEMKVLQKGNRLYRCQWTDFIHFLIAGFNVDMPGSRLPKFPAVL